MITSFITISVGAVLMYAGWRDNDDVAGLILIFVGWLFFGFGLGNLFV